MTETTTNATVLQYALTSDPDPVQVTTTNHESFAIFTVVASNPMVRDVTIDSIQFTFSLGPTANNLTNTKIAFFQTTMPSGWAVTKSGANIIFTPTAGSTSVGAEGLLFTFTLQINNDPGTTTITVTETGEDSGGVIAQPGTATLSVSKFPLQFTLTPLSANPQVLSGPDKPTTLDWNVYGTSAADDGSDYRIRLGYETATNGSTTQVGTSGPVTTLALIDSTLFTLTIDGTTAAGDQFTTASSVYVPVGPPLVTAFTATNGTQAVTVNYGEAATLAWTTQNATNVQLQPSGAQAYILDVLNTQSFEVLTLTSTSYYLSAEYKDGTTAPRTSQYGEPVNVTVAPPQVTDVQVMSTTDGNFVNAAYQLQYTAQSANYVCLTTTPDQGIAPAWYPVTQTTINIPTPTTQGVQYTLTAYQLSRNQIAIVTSGGGSSQVLAAEATTPASAKMSATLTFVSPGVHFANHKFPVGATGQTYTFSLSQNAAAYWVCINGFYFEYANGDAHYISSIGANIIDVTSTADTVTVNVTQLLNDEHSTPHTISSNAFIDVQLVWVDDTLPNVLAMGSEVSASPTTLTGPDIATPVNGIYTFNWNGEQSKISGFKLSSGTPTPSSGNEVATSGQKFEVDQNGSSYGTGAITWDTIAAIANQPGGIGWQTHTGCSDNVPYNVSGTGPINSIVVIPTSFNVNNSSNNENFHSMSLQIDVQGTPGDTTFQFVPNIYWHKSTGDGYTGTLDCRVLIKYDVPA